MILLAGCMSPSPLPEEHYYRLAAAQPPQAFGSPRIDGVLVVERPDASGVYAERALAYSEDPHQLRLERYHYHRWIDAPPRLLQQALGSYLRDANVAASVTLEAARLQPAYRISSLVRRFERIRSDGQWQAVVALELRVDPFAGDAPLLMREYHEAVPADGDSIDATVQAFAVATSAVFDAFLADLAGALEN